MVKVLMQFSNISIFGLHYPNYFKPYFLLLISSYFEIGLYSNNIPSIKFDVPVTRTMLPTWGKKKFDVPSKIWIFDGPSHPHSEVLGDERTV
jgi:hypothetical protein